MGTLHLSVLLVVICLAVNHFHGTESLKTLEQILIEIKSIAGDISYECRDDFSTIFCNSYLQAVNSSTNLTGICLAMDKYILCEDLFCDDKTTTFTQVLSDAMVIPYCAEMNNFPFNDTTVVEISHQMTEAVKLCTYMDEQNCDKENNKFLMSENLDDVCRAAKKYATCLGKNCVTSTYEFQKTLLDIQNRTECVLVPAPGGCSILQVSGLLMLLAAVINYI